MNITPYAPITYPLARMMMTMSRSIHEIVWALFFVAALGLGALPGIFALAVRSVGFIAKMSAEDIDPGPVEAIDMGPVEAMRSTGVANLFQVMLFGVVPQIRVAFTGIAIYTWDVAFRAATIVGFFGAGGMGWYLKTQCASDRNRACGRHSDSGHDFRSDIRLGPQPSDENEIMDQSMHSVKSNTGIKTGRAAVYDAPNTPFEIRRYPVRDAKLGEVLARIAMATICRSDIHSYQGHRPNPCPGILGHEIIGVVEQIGLGIEKDLRGDRLSIGDRITWTEYFHHGESYHRDIQDLPQKSLGLRKYGHDLVEDDPHFLGGFSDYCYVMPGTGILKLPYELSDEEATPLNCGVATMVSMAEAADIGMGDCVVVQGLGLLGLYGCAIAKARGARRVIDLDGVASRRSMAKRLGADDLSDEALIAHVKSLCRPDGANVVIEVCGLASAIPVGIHILGVGGRYVIGGLVTPNNTFTLDGNELLRKLITVKGVHNYHPRHLIQALDFVVANRKRFPFKDLVDAKFPLEGLNEAFTKAANRTVLRCRDCALIGEQRHILLCRSSCWRGSKCRSIAGG